MIELAGCWLLRFIPPVGGGIGASAATRRQSIGAGALRPSRAGSSGSRTAPAPKLGANAASTPTPPPPHDDADRPGSQHVLLSRGSVEGSNFYVTRTELHAALAPTFEAARATDSAAAHYAFVARAWSNADAPIRARADAANRKAEALRSRAERAQALPQRAVQ